MKIKEYDRQSAVNYAHKWSYLRNPNYYNFDPVGGDCTSFASQCIWQGSKIMNYEKTILGIIKMEMIKALLGQEWNSCIYF